MPHILSFHPHSCLQANSTFASVPPSLFPSLHRYSCFKTTLTNIYIPLSFLLLFLFHSLSPFYSFLPLILHSLMLQWNSLSCFHYTLTLVSILPSVMSSSHPLMPSLHPQSCPHLTLRYAFIPPSFIPPCHLHTCKSSTITDAFIPFPLIPRRLSFHSHSDFPSNLTNTSIPTSVIPLSVPLMPRFHSHLCPNFTLAQAYTPPYSCPQCPHSRHRAPQPELSSVSPPSDFYKREGICSSLLPFDTKERV